MIVAAKTGDTTQFCSRRCERYHGMGKAASKLKWTNKLVSTKARKEVDSNGPKTG